jgi:hypothetical protein
MYVFNSKVVNRARYALRVICNLVYLNDAIACGVITFKINILDVNWREEYRFCNFVTNIDRQ